MNIYVNLSWIYDTTTYTTAYIDTQFYVILVHNNKEGILWYVFSLFRSKYIGVVQRYESLLGNEWHYNLTFSKYVALKKLITIYIMIEKIDDLVICIM